MANKRLVVIVSIVGGLLLIPYIAMQLTDQVNWTLSDFVVAGVLLLSTGLICDFGIRKLNKVQHRILFGLAMFGVLFLVWAELAVGIFGTPFGGS
ncbi:MAG: hypothetical protein AAF587_10150 [Bacteroidota bacterium]